MRTTWVIGNWKMNGNVASNAALLEALVADKQLSSNVKVAVCVPYPYLAQAKLALSKSNVVIAAQDVSQFESGAYTGEVSAQMLKDFGVSLVLTGHSERRSLFGDGDAQVAAKTKAALNAGLTPVLCIGETLSERESGQAKTVVLSQLKAVVDVVGADGLAQCVLGYEPVWAIGTGKTASPEQVQEVHGWLRSALKELNIENVSVVYGGSVKASNANEIFGQVDVDGGLIGGASLISEEFLAIVAAAQ